MSDISLVNMSAIKADEINKLEKIDRTNIVHKSNNSI